MKMVKSSETIGIRQVLTGIMQMPMDKRRQIGYHFYENGYLDTGIYWSDSGKLYYYDENGKMLKGTGWYLDTYNIWHYIYSDGTIATGERTIGGKKYWFTGYGDWIR